MTRKHKVDEIHLKITNVIPFLNEISEGFTIRWCSDIGYGEYTIFKMAGTDMWVADAETMDNNEDKDFIRELMRLFIEELQIL